MKPLVYLLNLLYTVAFIYSLTKVADGSGLLWLFVLVVTTIVLTVIFLTHCYEVTERNESCQ